MVILGGGVIGELFSIFLRKVDINILFFQVLMVNGHSCVNIDHYEAVGILKAAGSVIALRVQREEYSDGKGDGGKYYDNQPLTFSRNLPPPLQTSSTSSIRHSHNEQVQMPQDPAHAHTSMHDQIPYTNGVAQVHSPH